MKKSSLISELATIEMLSDAFKVTSIKINSLITNGNKFKIGKSADKEEDTKKRYIVENYRYWCVIFQNSHFKIADDLEEKLIKKYRMTHPVDCKNEQIGGGAPNATYVYLAYD